LQTKLVISWLRTASWRRIRDFWTEVFGATINMMLAQGSRQDSEQVAEPNQVWDVWCEL
jgi:uncharacterized glyoxalase superfamily protein PhnB